MVKPQKKYKVSRTYIVSKPIYLILDFAFILRWHRKENLKMTFTVSGGGNLLVIFVMKMLAF